MAVRLSIITTRSTVAIACTLVVLAILSTRNASTQSTSGTEKQQISVLQKQLSDLNNRVKNLEQAASATAAADQVKPEPAVGEKPTSATMGARIAELEAEVRSLKSEEAGGGGSHAAGQIVAPFTVVDSAGKPLMRVTEEGHGFSRGIYVYDSKTVIAGHMGAAEDGSGRVYVTENGQLPMALMAVGSQGGMFQVSAGGKKSVLIDKFNMVFYTDGGNPLSLFGTKNRGKGYMELNDSGGSKMVEAGMLNEGKGYVLATPYRSSVGINGNPSVLMGGAGR